MVVGKKTKRKGIFASAITVEPIIVQQQVQDDGHVEEVITVAPKKERANKYLPGERLLKRINKDALKEKEQKKKWEAERRERELESEEEEEEDVFDISRMTATIRDILNA